MQREEQSKQRAQSAGMALVVRWTSAGRSAGGIQHCWRYSKRCLGRWYSAGDPLVLTSGLGLKQQGFFQVLEGRWYATPAVLCGAV